MINLQFESLVSEHAPKLKTYALHFTRDEQDAQDLVQDTVLKAMTYKEKFRQGTNLNGWLYTIMKNTFINNYRRISKINNVVTKSEEITSANLVYSSTANKGEDRFIMEDIKEALNKLSEECYVPFTMYFEGYKYQEIADHLCIPIGTVKTRIHVARKVLKKSLKSYSYRTPSSSLANVNY